MIFGPKKRATTSKTVKAPVKVRKNLKKWLKAKQKMWFVVKVLKIENGGEGYEVRGWGGRGGRKSGLS